ncbi:MAG TPA: non-ribosomal peptide synthetase, partial [Ktedonobacteraceae bacterium]|nr:non-ribosomal peptide synthetase [Ktedonobacteraceae bacterium]
MDMTKTNYPRESSLAELFEQQVQHRPEAIALVCDERHLSYAELNHQANRLAYHLQRRGVGPEIVVGLCLQRSIAMIVGLLAILKAGGAYLPLDPSSPTDRLAFMLADVGAHLLLTQASMQERFADLSVEVICLEQWSYDIVRASDEENPASLVGAEHLAYVIYTSGSTGQPKGVGVTHRNVIRLVIHTNYARLEAEEVFLQLAPLSFDASTFEIWACLLNGARLVLFPPVAVSLHELAQQLECCQITTLWLTAGLFHQMVEQHLPSLLQLRQLLAGGEALSISHVRQVLAQERGPVLINGYGPTEGTTFSCCYPMHVGHDRLQGSSVPIGWPIANTQVYVLDATGEPVLPGAVGELYIGGDGLARGYLHRPELTAERFVPHPFAGTFYDQSESYGASEAPEPGARLYRTGDLVRTLPDGRIEFVGRADRQIKLRGFRIELGEIEAVLCQHPAVQQALVLLREDRPGDKRLVAYLLPMVGASAGEAAVRQHLQQRLPDYMQPSALVWLDAFPLTPNGKIDQHALPVPEREAAQSEGEQVPRSPLQELLVTIWSQVLGHGQVGVAQNFFELGGHSLLA